LLLLILLLLLLLLPLLLPPLPLPPPLCASCCRKVAVLLSSTPTTVTLTGCASWRYSQEDAPLDSPSSFLPLLLTTNATDT
jgi:hypothetical protein